jgi:hypothetical protein
MRYFTRPTGWQGWDDDQPAPILSIQIEPSVARPTGLLNARGEQIWAQPDPIGFRFQENAEAIRPPQAAQAATS